MYWNKNKGIRAVISNTTQVDVHIIGFAVEQNHRDAPEVNNKNVNSFTIHYLLDGHGYLIQNEKKHELRKGTIFVTFPNQNVQHRQDSVDSWKVGWIVCDGLKVAGYLERCGITPEHPFIHLDDDKELQELFSRTPYKCVEYYGMSDVIALAAFYQILISLYKYQPNQVNNKKRRTEEQHVANAIEYINQNYMNSELSLATVAGAIGITSKYLSAIFKRITNISFTRHLLNKRLSAANALIEEGHTVVSEIAYKVGFSSPYYFSNVYKKYNTDSPRTHIKQYFQKKSESEEK